MEVVCLILGPTLTSRPCSHMFWVLTSLHLLPFLLKMFFIIPSLIRYPKYYYEGESETQYRDLWKAYGIWFVIEVSGQVRPINTW